MAAVDFTGLPEWVLPGQFVVIMRQGRSGNRVTVTTVERVTTRDIVLNGDNGRFRRAEITSDRTTVQRATGDMWSRVYEELVARNDPRVTALRATINRDNTRARARDAATLMNDSTATAGALDNLARVEAAITALTAWADTLQTEAAGA